MRAFALSLLTASALSCTSPNELFSPLATLATTDDATTGGTTTEGSSTAAPTTGQSAMCRELAPRGEGNAVCELDAPNPLDIATHPSLMGSCAGGPVTQYAVRPVGDDTIVQLCDEGCGTCEAGVSIDLDDPSYQFLVPFGILAPAGVCMRVVHEGSLAQDGSCRTAKIAVWDDRQAPRFVAGIDTLDTFAELELGIAADEPWLCMCSDADKADVACCNYVVEYSDLIVTSSEGCQYRVARGTQNLQTFAHLGEQYDFTAFNAYTFVGCPADDTTYWIMKRR